MNKLKVGKLVNLHMSRNPYKSVYAIRLLRTSENQAGLSAIDREHSLCRGRSQLHSAGQAHSLAAENGSDESICHLCLRHVQEDPCLHVSILQESPRVASGGDRSRRRV